MTAMEVASLLMMPVGGLILAGAAVYFANHMR